MEDIISVSNKIESKIKALESGRKQLQTRATEKANSLATYDKEIAKALIGLKNGKEFKVDGEKIVNPPASIMEKLARGICYQEKIKSELAEARYKNATVGIGAIQAELNGYQSIYRHLENKL